TSGDFAFLSTVPAAIGFAFLIVGDVAAGQKLPRRLGYSIGRLPVGVIAGVLGAMIVLPMMYASSGALEVVYQVLNVRHPHEHELLGAMKDASVAVKAMLVIGACVMAPIFEEMLFRAHIQTTIVRLFSWRREPPVGYVTPPGLPDVLPVPPINLRANDPPP